MILRVLRFLVVSLSVFATVRMGIITDGNWVGEREVAWRIKRAAEVLGWEVFLDETQGEQIFHMNDLDWTVHLVPAKKFSKGLHYRAVFHEFGFLGFEGKLRPEYDHYDGYLIGIKSGFFNEAIRSHKKPFTLFYPTLQSIDHVKVELNYIVTIFPAWGHRLKEKKYNTLYQLLSQSGVVKFYGAHLDSKMIGQGWMGNIAYDGISVVKALQKHGIVLILHSWYHRNQAVPSPRIFEAAAASTVIISDENPFVKEHFGDSVYYIDVTLSAEEIFKQIMDCKNEIFKDPDTALEKAKQAHQIFKERFQMTDQLIELHKMHQQILHGNQNY